MRRRAPVVLDCAPDTDATINTDEARVRRYRLPDPLVARSGRPVDADSWPARRDEILELFEDHVYGRTPIGEVAIVADETESGLLIEGRARRRQIRLDLSTERGSLTIELLLVVPAELPHPAPVFVVPNFDGNHTVLDDPAVFVSAGAERDRPRAAGARGSKARRFPLTRIVDRGYGLATFYSGDADTDADDGFVNGAQPLFYTEGQTEPAPDEWGTVGAWAWGCSRILDHLLTDDTIDGTRVIVGGHSRMGKAALWAAAQDLRFAAAFSNDSGCSGAALSRRRFGENVGAITALFPHWFCRNYRCYANDEDALPIDQHQLLALLAPRPVHVASASDDRWADPRGEFLSALAAGPVYELLGSTGLAIDEFPEPGAASLGPVSYHLRAGEHDLLASDWEHYLDFADQLSGPRETTRRRR